MPTAAVSSGPGAALSKAFEELFREHYQLIYRTAFSVTGRRQDAEDVLQTIFLRLLQSGLPPDFSKNPKGYLYRAAINLSLNTVRDPKRESATDSMDRLLAPVAPGAAGQDHGLRGHLLNAIAQLNPRAVEMLVLRYEHGYSDAGIAAMLGKSRGTVAVTLYRTRARLKKLLSRETSGGRP